MFIKKLVHLILIILFLIDINFSAYATDSKKEEINKDLAALEINPDEAPEEKAEKIFRMSLLLDLFAVKDLYFKGLTEEAEELLCMISIGYKMVLGYYPNHPLAQLFFDAHRHPGESGFVVEGDPTSMVAISGLYTDGIEDDVPDDWSMQAFWFARSAQKTALAQDGKKLLEDRQKGAWVTFSAKELASLLAFEGTGIVGGFAAGQALQQALNQSYWVYIGLGMGAAGGALAWFASSQCYNMYQKCKEKRRSKKNLNKLKEAEDDEIEDIIAMEEGRSKKLKESEPSSDQKQTLTSIPAIESDQNSSIEKLSKYQTLSRKEKKKLDDKFLIHLYGSSEDDQKFVNLYRKITQHERMSIKNDELQKRSPRKEVIYEEGRFKRWSKALLDHLSTFNPWGQNQTSVEEDHSDHKKQHEDIIDDDSLDIKPQAQSMPNMPFHEDFVEIAMPSSNVEDFIINVDEKDIEKAEKIFRIVLNLDNFAIKKLHFQGHAKEAEKLMYMIAVGYKMVVGYNPHHPYAQLFFDAHDHPNEEGLMIPGDQTAQKAISVLFSDNIEDEVPDDRQVEAYWIGRSLLESGQSIKPTSAQEDNKAASFLSFTAKEFGALCAAEVAGLVAGYALGDVLTQSFGAYYWTYIGLGIGGAGGFLTWLGGLKIPEIYKWCSTKFQHKEDLEQINNAFYDTEAAAIENDKDQIKNTAMDEQDMEEPQVESLPKLKSGTKTPSDDLVEHDDKLSEPTTTHEDYTIQNKPANIDEIQLIEVTTLPSNNANQLNDEFEIQGDNQSVVHIKPNGLGVGEQPATLNSSRLKTSSQKSVQVPKTISSKEEDALHEKFLQRLYTYGADDPFVRRYLELTKGKRVEATYVAKSKCDAKKQKEQKNNSHKESQHRKYILNRLSRGAAHLNPLSHFDEYTSEDDEDDRRLNRTKKKHKKSRNPYESSSSHFKVDHAQYDDPYDDIYPSNIDHLGTSNAQYDRYDEDEF